MSMNFSRVTVCAAALALVSGCASMNGLAPRGQADAASGLAATATLAQAQLAEAQWPEADWWKRFSDPQLDALEAEALAGSPSLQISLARVDKARAAAGIVRSAQLPQVDANLKSTRQRFSENDAVAPPLAGSWRTANRLGLDFGYEFDFWGKNRAAYAAATSSVQAAKVDAFAARLLLSVSVARDYVHLARTGDLLDVAQATLTQRQQIYDLTAQRVAAGLGTQVELKQAEAALPSTREEIAALQETAALTRNQLAALLGDGPDRGLKVTRPHLANTTTASVLPSRLPSDLLGRRPDVVASRWRVEAAAKNIDVNKARFYPDVDLLAFVGFQSLGLSSLLQAGSGIADIGPALHLPIFEGGRLRSQLARADADYHLAVGLYNQTLADALRDIGDQLTLIRSVQTQSEQQRIAVSAATGAYQLALLRYREGVGDYLSVLATETLVLTQRRAGVDLRAREWTNRIELIRALGGGFEDRPSADAAA